VRFARQFTTRRSLRSPVTVATASVVNGAILLSVPFPAHTWSEGQHVYISFMSLSILSKFQSHPFSIANAPHTGDDATTSNLQLILRTKGGVTKTLARYINQHAVDGIATLKVVVEGPYGHGSTASVAGDFETVLLFAGGSGITHPASVLDALTQLISHQKIRTSSAHLVWAVQHLGASQSHFSILLIISLTRVGTVDQTKWIKQQLHECLALASPLSHDRNLRHAQRRRRP